MDFLKFDKKADGCPSSTPSLVPEGLFECDVHCGQTIVRNQSDGENIYAQGCFGHFLKDRPNQVNTSVFVQTNLNDEPKVKRMKKVKCEKGLNDEAQAWEALVPADTRLRLSPEESFYLFSKGSLKMFHQNSEMNERSLWSYFRSKYGITFIKRYLLYRSLREEGWCVRCGQSFGCEYLVYKWNASSYHATAAVKLTESPIDPFELSGLNRALFNVKKSLFICTVELPLNGDREEMEILENSTIKIVSTSTFFPDRSRQ